MCIRDSEGTEQSSENCPASYARCGYVGAFALAAINIGESGSDLIVRAETETGAVLSLCQTDVVTGACLNPPAEQQVGLDIDSGGVGTYSVFVHSKNKLGAGSPLTRLTN